MNKTTALFFYGSDGNAAKAAAAAHRKTEGPAFVRHAEAFRVSDPVEPVDAVYVLPCVDDFGRKQIASVYGDKVKTSDAIAPLPAPPPSTDDPLAALPADWQQTVATKQLKSIAAAISGRTVDNRPQAIEVIDAEIARRAAPLPPPPPPVS